MLAMLFAIRNQVVAATGPGNLGEVYLHEPGLHTAAFATFAGP